MGELFIEPTWNKVFQYVKYGKPHHVTLGGTDSGKTNFWLWFLDGKPSYFRVIIINSLGLFDYDKFCDRQVSEQSISRIQDGLAETKSDGTYKYKTINYVPRPKTRTNLKDMQRDFNDLCTELMNYEDANYSKYMKKKYHKIAGKDFQTQARIIIIVDELADFCEGEKIQPSHLRIIREGRNHGIIHIGNTQRSQGISKWIITQSKTKYLFEIDLYDIFRLSRKIENIEKIRELYPYHFMVVHGLKSKDKHYFKPCPKMKGLIDENEFKR